MGKKVGLKSASLFMRVCYVALGISDVLVKCDQPFQGYSLIFGPCFSLICIKRKIVVEFQKTQRAG